MSAAAGTSRRPRPPAPPLRRRTDRPWRAVTFPRKRSAGWPAIAAWSPWATTARRFLFHPPGGNPLAAVPPREHVVGAVAGLRHWAEESELLEAGCDVP
jgi:hypothetical protein